MADFNTSKIFQYLEEEILFKNQELKELLADLHCRDEEIKMWEESWYRSQQSQKCQQHYFAQL